MCAPSWRRNCLPEQLYKRKKKKKKKKNNKKMEHLKKAPNHRGQSGPVPHKNRAWWEKAAKWHRISPEDSVWTFVMPLFFLWFMNECCPVGFKGKKKFFVWIAQALDCVGFIHFYFNIILFFCTLDSHWSEPIEGSLKSWKKQHPTALLFTPRINTLAIKRTILTQTLILWHWRSIWWLMHQKTYN